MPFVLIRHKVQDFNRWKEIYDSAVTQRQTYGEKFARVFHDASDPNDLIILAEFETHERARRFFASDWLREAMSKAGVQGPPQVQYLLEGKSLRRTAAD